MATLVETDRAEEPTDLAAVGLGLKRLDVSLDAWQQSRRPDDLFVYWKTTIAQPDQKKKLFVDNDVLMNLFLRLAETDQPQRLAFRFVLALMLMRKKLLKYEHSEKRRTEGEEQEWWLMLPKGLQDPVEVLNPQLDGEQVRQVAEQLSEILEAEF